jgi:hypothetical protein
LTKVIDLTGQRFGRLIVIERVEKPKNRKTKGSYWKCICDCGNEKIITSNNLKNGTTNSCGCLAKELLTKRNYKKNYNKKKYRDLTGQRFGKLVVLEKIKTVNKYDVIWKCKCDCGNFINVESYNLQSYHRKSCGCLRGGKNIKDEIGKKYGKLTVIGFSQIKKNGAYWLVQCDCGSLPKEVCGSQLRNGNIKSCGCSHKDTGVKSRKKETPGNTCFSNYKGKAKRKGIIFDLSKDFFLKLTQQKCYYCGCEPYQRVRTKEGWTHENFYYNGLDRIDSSNGYTEDNVVPCCGICNTAKLAMPREDFLSWVERVYNHSIKGKDMSNFNTEKYLEDAINKMLENETFRKQWELRDENQKEEFKIGLYNSIVIPMLKFKNNLSDK